MTPAEIAALLHAGDPASVQVARSIMLQAQRIDRTEDRQNAALLVLDVLHDLAIMLPRDHQSVRISTVDYYRARNILRNALQSPASNLPTEKAND